MYLTAYTSGATTGTVTRAQESTSGVTFTGTNWIHGPTNVDFSPANVGGTAGAPTTGTYVVGQFWTDSNNTLWVCTAAGTPGTWVQLGPPTGSVQAYAASTAPSGWLLCDGSQVSRTTYATLFALIGTTYGVGDGSTTFNIPDMRERIPIGLGTQNTLSANDGVGTSPTAPVDTLRVSGKTFSTTTVANNTGTGTTSSASSSLNSFAGGGSTGATQITHTHSIPALTIPSLTVNAASLYYQVLNFIIKT